jgi:hypothetical protein
MSSSKVKPIGSYPAEWLNVLEFCRKQPGRIMEIAVVPKGGSLITLQNKLRALRTALKLDGDVYPELSKECREGRIIFGKGIRGTVEGPVESVYAHCAIRPMRPSELLPDIYAQAVAHIPDAAGVKAPWEIDYKEHLKKH